MGYYEGSVRWLLINDGHEWSGTDSNYRENWFNFDAGYNNWFLAIYPGDEMASAGVGYVNGGYISYQYDEDWFRFEITTMA